MKIKLIDIINTKKELNPLLELRFPYRIRRQLKELIRTFEKEFEDYAEEELKYIKQYAKLDKDGKPILVNGNILNFDSIENKQKYNEIMTEIHETEIDWTFPVIEISEKDMDGQKISVTTEMELEPFIIFKE